MPTSSHSTNPSILPRMVPEDGSPECYQSWVKYLKDVRSFSSDYLQNLPTVLYTVDTATSYFVTVQTLAEGRPYAECDGIPRFRPTGPPTSTRTDTVTMVDKRTFFDNKSLTFPWFKNPLMEPTCEADRQSCRRLWAMAKSDVRVLPAGSFNVASPARACPLTENAKYLRVTRWS
jgi:hypothetical protein